MSDEQTTVIAFRVAAKDAMALDDRAEANRIVNVRSGNQFARKIVLDFLKGRLIYVSRVDQLRDPMLDK
jgi:hypothetical protein